MSKSEWKRQYEQERAAMENELERLQDNLHTWILVADKREQEIEQLRSDNKQLLLTKAGVFRKQMEYAAEAKRLQAYAVWSDKTRGDLEHLVSRAADVFDCHIDTPQACSHAELRATAREFRRALEEELVLEKQFPSPKDSDYRGEEA